MELWMKTTGVLRMKHHAISIKQPWASLIANGHKTIETRTWYTKYRGDILICASKKPDMACVKTDFPYPMIEDLPYGQAIAIATIVDCRKMTTKDAGMACCPVYPGAYAWVLKDVRQINPFPVKGQLGIFKIDRGHGSLLTPNKKE